MDTQETQDLREGLIQELRQDFEDIQTSSYSMDLLTAKYFHKITTSKNYIVYCHNNFENIEIIPLMNSKNCLFLTVILFLQFPFSFLIFIMSLLFFILFSRIASLYFFQNSCHLHLSFVFRKKYFQFILYFILFLLFKN